MKYREQPTAINILLASGDILKSRYRILRQLGHRKFGRIYLAEDIHRFNEYCVLKEFAPQLQNSLVKRGKKLFEQEANVLYRLQHLQIPKLRELFCYQQENQEGLFLVQDYVEGQTYQALLNERLNYCSQEARKFSEAEVEDLLAQMLPLLTYIHSMGIIHRNIAPDNIILRSEDQLPMLLNFGSIQEVESQLIGIAIDYATPEFYGLGEITVSPNFEEASKFRRTQSDYAPPEQTEQGLVSAHSDLYGLAATAVVLLTGKQPQQLLEPNSHWWNWQSEVTLSPKLTWILSTMLNPDPSDRFDSAAEVIETLQEISSLSLSPQTTVTINTSPSVNHQPQTKIKSLTCSIFKLLFFLPFTAVLILGGVLCWEKENLDNHFKPNTLIKIQPSDRRNSSYQFMPIVSLEN
ncbi:MAG: protein kinase domain-containing protein [Waterburya sp.]